MREAKYQSIKNWNWTALPAAHLRFTREEFM
ncbi:trp operon leader peptide [Eubacteriales bacterium KG127]